MGGKVLLMGVLSGALLFVNTTLAYGQGKAIPKLGVDLHSIGIATFPLVRLQFVITDPTGRAVSGLRKENFRVLENMRTAKIERLEQDVTPLSVVLLLDRSGSMFGALDQLKMAARKFISLMEPQDRTMLIDFSDEPKILCDFSNDRSKLEACLHTMRAWGPTALYDSLYRSVLEAAGQPGRRVIVALTDGTDQNEERTAPLSRHNLKEVLVRALKEKVPIYTVGMGFYVEKKELTLIAQKTGGLAFFAPTPGQLVDLYTKIASNLKSRVNLLYRSPNAYPDGSWREVEVRCVISSAPAGRAEEKYRAPGRYVLEVEGQGWMKLKEEELETQLPSLVIKNRRLEQILQGKPVDLDAWFKPYFSRESAAGAPIPESRESAVGAP